MRQGSILDVNPILDSGGTDPIGAEITLIFTSQASEGGPQRHHALIFHVALRGPILRNLPNS
jgi:type IV pilus assembly protein PilW